MGLRHWALYEDTSLWYSLSAAGWDLRCLARTDTPEGDLQAD